MTTPSIQYNTIQYMTTRKILEWYPPGRRKGRRRGRPRISWMHKLTSGTREKRINSMERGDRDKRRNKTNLGTERCENMEIFSTVCRLINYHSPGDFSLPGDFLENDK